MKLTIVMMNMVTFTINKTVDSKGHESRVPVVGKGVEGQVHRARGCNRMILQKKLDWTFFPAFENKISWT